MSRKIVQKILFICRWAPIILCLLFVLIVLLRIPAVLETKKTGETVSRIQSKQITKGDVLGNNPPPVPDQTENNKTLAGVDSNNNGIRDDIELVLFSTTPNVRIRAAELQYVLAKQLYVTDVFNSATWIATAVQENRAFQCLGQTLRQTGVNEDDVIPMVLDRTAELKALILNTQARQHAYDKNMHFIAGYVLDASHVCDYE